MKTYKVIEKPILRIDEDGELTPSEIKFNTIKLINGIKYMTKNQVEDCKAYVRHSLKLDDIDENNNAIEEAIKIYFKQLV